LCCWVEKVALILCDLAAIIGHEATKTPGHDTKEEDLCYWVEKVALILCDLLAIIGHQGTKTPGYRRKQRRFVLLD